MCTAHLIVVPWCPQQLLHLKVAWVIFTLSDEGHTKRRWLLALAAPLLLILLLGLLLCCICCVSLVLLLALLLFLGLLLLCRLLGSSRVR
jgi:hypothetical protein